MSENEKEKINFLIHGFPKQSLNTKMTKKELTKFLDNYSSSGKFDQTLSHKLFQVLNLDETSSITVENFISGFIQFEEDIKSNLTQLKQKLEEKKETYEKLITEIKLNEETCTNSKVYCEITDIDIKRKLNGINEIILKVIFNEKKEVFHFKLGVDENILLNGPKIFEFKPTSRNDHFEFIMEGLNSKNKIFDIGSKVFSLTEIKNSEEYLVQIIIPELDDEKKAAAYINAKIILTWNDKKYEKKKENLKIKIKKIKTSLSKAVDYLRKIKDVYEKLKKIKKTKKNKNNLPDLDVYFNNKKKEIIQNKYIVEFNNKKEVFKIEKIQKNEKEGIKDDESIDDINIEEKKQEKDFKEEDNTDSEIIEDKNDEVKEEEKEEVLGEKINDEKMIINNITKKENEEVKDIKEEIKKEEEVKQEKEIEIKELEEKNNENSNMYNAEKYNNEIINPNIQYNINTTPIINEQISNQKGEYQEINIDDYLQNNTNTTNNINTTYGVYQNQTNNNYLNYDNILNENISQSINNQIATARTLPVIVKKKVHKVVYDSYVKTLPLIFGGTKVTYLKNNESINYKNNNIIQNYIPLTKAQIITPTQNVYNQNVQVQTFTQKNPIQSFNQIQTTNTNNTISQIENELKNNLSQSYTLQEYPVQTYNILNNIPNYGQINLDNSISNFSFAKNDSKENIDQTYNNSNLFTLDNLTQSFGPIQTDIKINNEQVYNQIQRYTQNNPIQINNYNQTYTQKSFIQTNNPINAYNQIQTNTNLNINQGNNQTALNQESETDYRLLSIVRNYNPILGNNIDQMGIDYGSLQLTFNQNYNVNEYNKTLY